MGKHKKHKKHRTEHGVHFPGYGSTGESSMAGSPKLSPGEEMRVVVRLPQPLTSQQGRLYHSPVVSHYEEEPMPSELVVSIPLTLLHQATNEPEGASASEHRHHHKHKKHKKHKKHHQHSASEAMEHTGGKPSISLVQNPPIVAPIKLKVPKPVSTASFESHHHPSMPSLPTQFQSPQQSMAQGEVRTHGQTSSHVHKHHHKHKHRKRPHAALESNEQGQRQLHQGSDFTPSLQVPSGKPLAQMYHHSLERSKQSPSTAPVAVATHKLATQESPLQESSGHKHHKKKKKKHKHSKSVHHLPSHEQTQPAFEVPPWTFPVAPIRDKPKHDVGDATTISRHHRPPSFDEQPPPAKKIRVEEKPVAMKTISHKTPKTNVDAASDHSLPRKHTVPPSKVQLTPLVKIQPEKFDTPKAHRTSYSSTKVDTGLKSQQTITAAPSVPVPSPAPKPAPVPAPATVPAPVPVPPPQTHLVPETRGPQVKLSKSALKFFLKNLHHLIHKRDTEGIFAEPVTDDIAPGYSQRIVNPMDLSTMASKIESDLYTSVSEFKNDFVLMCNNAMTYNAPETMYYSAAKRLLTTGLKTIAKETSLRPDIQHGSTRAESVSPLPPEFHIPAPTNHQLDYTSPFIVRLDITQLRSSQKTTSTSTATDQTSFLNIDLSELSEVSDQSHLTKVVVGCEEERNDGGETTDEILMQVEEAAEASKENLDANKPNTRFCFLNQNDEGKTMINFMNPDSGDIDSSKPVDLTVLSDHVRMGNNAATVLKTELPMMKATPVSYLMYGPFGSFAPTYDSSFATLSKMDSELLLHTYGSEVGISYAHSLQQFVKGTGSFVSEMADAVLNGLTNGRHSKFLSKTKSLEEKDQGKTPKDQPLDSKPIKEESSPPPKDNNTPPPPVTKEDASSSVSKECSPQVTKETSPSSTKETSPPVSKDTLRSPPAIVKESSPAISIEHSPAAAPSKDQSPLVSKEHSPADKDEEPMEYLESDRSNEVENVLVSDVDRDTESDLNKPFRDSSVAPSENGSSVVGMSEMSESRRGSMVSFEGSGLVSREESVGKDSGADTPTELKDSERSSLDSPALSDDIDARLRHTSNLLSELQKQQNERLSLPPVKNTEGHMVLSGPSHEETNTVQDIRTELASLTAQVRPSDVISVPALHRAMGITIEPQQDKEDSNTNPKTENISMGSVSAQYNSNHTQ